MLKNLSLRNIWLFRWDYYVVLYICSNILVKEEFGKANNYISLYNSLVDEFFSFYNSRYVTDREWR